MSSLPLELYPIRINVSYPPPSSASADSSAASFRIRIVDTFLVDPSDFCHGAERMAQWAHALVTDALGSYPKKKEPLVEHHLPAVQSYLIHQVQWQIQSQCRAAQEMAWRFTPSDHHHRGGGNRIPIRLRLELPQGIRVHDDFLYDPSAAVDPMTMAQSLVSDLQLPLDAIPTISMHISEQILLYYSSNQPKEEEEEEDNMQQDEGLLMGPPRLQQRPSRHGNATAAWEISTAIQATNVRHLELAQARQQP